MEEPKEPNAEPNKTEEPNPKQPEIETVDEAALASLKFHKLGEASYEIVPPFPVLMDISTVVIEHTHPFFRRNKEFFTIKAVNGVGAYQILSFDKESDVYHCLLVYSEIF